MYKYGTSVSQSLIVSQSHQNEYFFIDRNAECTSISIYLPSHFSNLLIYLLFKSIQQIACSTLAVELQPSVQLKLELELIVPECLDDVVNVYITVIGEAMDGLQVDSSVNAATLTAIAISFGVEPETLPSKTDDLNQALITRIVNIFKHVLPSPAIKICNDESMISLLDDILAKIATAAPDWLLNVIIPEKTS